MCGAFSPHWSHLNPAGDFKHGSFSRHTAKTFTWQRKYRFERHKLRNLTLSIKVSFREEVRREGGREGGSQERAGKECWNFKKRECEKAHHKRGRGGAGKL